VSNHRKSRNNPQDGRIQLGETSKFVAGAVQVCGKERSVVHFVVSDEDVVLAQSERLERVGIGRTWFIMRQIAVEKL
jgi:hypothetical protein